jgi:uncharacterized membrane-anchored protein
MNDVGKYVQTLIDIDTYRKLIVKCSQENLKISQALRQLINDYVKDVDKEVKAYA